MNDAPPGARVVLRDVCVLLHVPAGMALVSIPVAWWAGDGEAVWSFGCVGGIGVGLGQLGYRLARCSGQTRLPQAVVTAALAWLIIPLLGALPFLLRSDHAANSTLAAFREPMNAFFESFSGFTGTGLTVSIHASELPAGLQWWRSFSEWVGGIGVIALMLSVLDPRGGFYRLYFSEAREHKILPSVAGTARTIWWIYVPMTIVAVLAFRVSGVPWWEALHHGMTGVSTGGFSVTDDSFAGYPEHVLGVGMVVMLAGACSFGVYFRLFTRRDVSVVWKDGQSRGLLVFGCVGLLIGWIVAAGVTDRTWVQAMFDWVSALSTAGFASGPARDSGVLPMLLLVVAMTVGAAAGSTGGGIKQYRFWFLIRAVRWQMRAYLKIVGQVMRYEFHGEVFDEVEAQRAVARAALFVVAWFSLAAIAVFWLLAVVPPQFDLADVVFEVCSAQANVGLSSGITDPSLHAAGKSCLMFAMWIGRLEIIPILILLRVLLHPQDVRAMQ